MPKLFTDQLEYIYFFYALSFFILFITCFSFRFKKDHTLPWKYLGLFGVFHGLNEFLDMIAFIYNDTPFFYAIRLVIMGLSFVFLFEFGRNKFPKYIYLLLFPLSLVGILFSPVGVNVTIRYVFGFLGSLFASILIIKTSFHLKASNRRYVSLLFSGFWFFVYAFLTGIIGPKENFFPANIINQVNFQNFFGVPVQLFRGLSSLMAALLIWRHYKNKYMENRRGYGDAIISSVLVIIVLGFFVTDYIGKYERQNYKNEFLNDTIIFSAGINPRRVSSLSWNTSDNYNPDYVRLRELLQLMDNHKNNIRWFYLMGLKNERIYFLVDSVNQNSPDHAEPGLEYSHPSQDFIAAFKNGKNVVTEPYTDEWGTFISALVPVRDFDTGKTLAVFGADINTSEFSHKIEMIKLYPIGITFLITMMLIGYFISKQRDEETKIVLENASNELLKFKLAVDNASNHIVITDTEGIVIYANPAVSTITGYSHNEIIGSKAGVLWGKLMDKKFYEMFWRTIKYEKKSFEGEVTNHRKNGETYDAHVNVSPVLNSNGKLTFFVGIERDITKEKNVDRMKTEFISLASHQLRTPLTAMKWYLEMLLNGDAGKLSTEQHDFINNVELSNNRMIELVNSLLNVSRIDSGKIAIEPVSTNLKELIDSSISDLRNKFKEKNIQLLINISSEITTIYVDQKLIRQVLINLLSNAAKYTPKDGIVSIQATKEGNNIILKVKDTGYGIPSKDKDKVFTKFYRGDNVVKLETEGNGLGLYLVKSIIVSSGGKIWFESIEGNGTTFWISLPISNTTGTVM